MPPSSWEALKRTTSAGPGGEEGGGVQVSVGGREVVCRRTSGAWREDGCARVSIFIRERIGGRPAQHARACHAGLAPTAPQPARQRCTWHGPALGKGGGVCEGCVGQV